MMVLKVRNFFEKNLKNLKKGIDRGGEFI